MKLLKKYKKDLLLILLYTCIYFVIILILTRNGFTFASTTDFKTQHYLFPEYFRNLFYATKDLFPDFALNIGGGQNIYNFSYYGLFNPFIMISYLFPNISMFNFLMFVSYFIVISSTFLFYKFLKHHKIKESTAIITSLLFLFSTPIIFHAKRHIMFINYFPFLILGLFGVDRFLVNKKVNLLITSVTLMILTSFYYSVSGIFVLIFYAIYRYFSWNDNKNIKNFILFLVKFAFLIFVSVLMTSILWLPTLYTLISGRADAINEIEIWKLFLPSFKAFYTAYSPGITLFEFFLIIMLLRNKKISKETKVAVIFLILILLFPIFNFIFNGTLYINAKSLIPFLPLILLFVALSIDYFKYRKLIKTYLIFSTCIICIIGNFFDHLVFKKDIYSRDDKNYYELVKYITDKDLSFYRIANLTNNSTSLNKVYHLKEYKSSVYSSTQNINYQRYLINRQKINQIYRNNMMSMPSENILTSAMMGEKYVISDEKLGAGYHLIKTIGNLSLYENEFSLPIIYATSNNITLKKYNRLTYPNTMISSYANGNSGENKLTPISFKIKDFKNLHISKDQTINIKAKNNNYLVLNSDENLENKIVFITFKNKYNKPCTKDKSDQIITINNIHNKLTCKDWKYHNQNNTFHYVLVAPNELKITFSKAKYKLTDFSLYSIDKNEFLDAKENVIPLKIDYHKTKGDYIIGSIDVDSKQNIVTSIPYDKGFEVFVDSKKVNYQKSVQNGLIFSVDKGKHEIKLVYHAPYKKVGVILTIIGCLIFLGLNLKKMGHFLIHIKILK